MAKEKRFVKKNVGLEMILVKENLVIKKFDPKKFWSKNILAQKNIGQKNVG